MPEMIAYCGLVCSDCPTFLATRNDDDDARKKTARLYAEKFGLDVKPEDINCDGCKSEGGKRIGYCRTCAVRACSSEKGLEHCLFCDDQPCETLREFHTFSPEAKACFEALKKV
jgi:uncharacterized protein DUF3795